MSRSAYLPDDSTLSRLLDRAGAAVAAPRGGRRVGAEPAPAASRSGAGGAFPRSEQPGRAVEDGSGTRTATVERAGSGPPRASERVAADATTVSSRPAPSSVTPAELEQALARCSSLQERFEAVASWLSRATGALRVFVVDADGLTLSGGVDDVYEAAAGDLGMRLLATRALLPGVTQSGARLTMDSGEHLEVVWCDTRLGQVGVGAISRSPLPGSWSGMVPGVLRRAVDA